MKKRVVLIGLLVLPIALFFYLREMIWRQPRSVGVSYPDVTGFIRFTKDSREIGFGWDWLAFGENHRSDLTLFNVRYLNIHRSLPIEELNNPEIFNSRSALRAQSVTVTHTNGSTTFRNYKGMKVTMTGTFSWGIFSPDSRFQGVGSGNDVVLYNVATAKQIRTLEHKEDIYSAEFSPDSSTLAVLTYSHITMWNIQ